MEAAAAIWGKCARLEVNLEVALSFLYISLSVAKDYTRGSQEGMRSVVK